jgi:hypothetical protein
MHCGTDILVEGDISHERRQYELTVTERYGFGVCSSMMGRRRAA